MSNQNRDVMFQVSLLQGLTNGDYDGSVALGELKRRGDTGIGTFEKLNGELIMLDGEIYRAAGDGTVETAPDDETTPFAVVNFMDADETKTLRDIPDFEALCAELDNIAHARGKNRFYMVRMDGAFRRMHVRSIGAQQKPYRRLAKVLTEQQTLFDYTDVEGTVVGLYCPPYLSSLNAVGWHMHFISKDKARGGHVLGLQVDEALLTWDDIDAFQVQLPQSEVFAGFDLTVDQSADIKKVETNK